MCLFFYVLFVLKEIWRVASGYKCVTFFYLIYICDLLFTFLYLCDICFFKGFKPGMSELHSNMVYQVSLLSRKKLKNFY